MSRKSSRRAFLRGKSAAEAVQDLTLAGDAAEPTDSSAEQERRESYLLQIGRKAMACDFELFFNAGQYHNAAQVAVEALDLVEEIESQLTVYRGTSELLSINQLAFQQSVRAEFRLFKLLEFALELHDASNGAFDITSTPLSDVWGFSRRQGRLPNDSEIENALQRVGSQHVQLNANSHSIRFSNEEVVLNLNSIGKGYALDRSAELLEDAEINDVLLHGGHSSILALGRRLRGERHSGWTIAVRHPLVPSEQLGSLVVENRAIGTSGSANQFFYHQGRRFSHVLDPRSGRPAEGTLSVTVLTENAAAADALATACFVLGPAESEKLCQQYNADALFVLPGDRAGKIEYAVVGDLSFDTTS